MSVWSEMTKCSIPEHALGLQEGEERARIDGGDFSETAELMTNNISAVIPFPDFRAVNTQAS